MFNRLLGKEEEKEEPSLLEEANQLCSLSWKHRLYGFLICFALGALFSLIAIFFVGSIVIRPSAFAVPYTLGNICALGSTMFLMGPWRQIKNMFNPTRLIATLVYLGALALTLYAAFGLKSAILVLLAVIIQFCALVWYSLSYIPYARTLCTKCLGSLVSV